METIILPTNNIDFVSRFKDSLVNFYGNSTEIKETGNEELIFKIPFESNYYSLVYYNRTSVKIGKESDISGSEMSTPFLFQKYNNYTSSNNLILKENFIVLIQSDDSSSRGGSSIYSFIQTDKGLVFFSCCKSPKDIDVCKSIHIESGLDLIPVTFGNQVLSDSNEVLKQPFRLTDKNGEIYTAIDIYNISYKPDSQIALPKSVITEWNLASKDNPQEPIMTSLLIYDEEEQANGE